MRLSTKKQQELEEKAAVIVTNKIVNKITMSEIVEILVENSRKKAEGIIRPMNLEQLNLIVNGKKSRPKSNHRFNAKPKKRVTKKVAQKVGGIKKVVKKSTEFKTTSGIRAKKPQKTEETSVWNKIKSFFIRGK